MQLRAPGSRSSAPASVGEWLEQRLRDDPARPLLVWYGPEDERVELSAQTFANWVDKTVNLLGDLGADELPVVGAPLVNERPGHWVSLVWAAATWQCGGQLQAGSVRELQAVDVAVIGPLDPRPVPGVDTIACSLHPLGAGFTDLAPGLVDYQEVLAQPDVHSPAVVTDDEDPAWRDRESNLTHGELVAAVAGDRRRRLVPIAGTNPWQVVRTALLEPLRGGGSAVLVEGDASAERLSGIAEAEKADLG